MKRLHYLFMALSLMISVVMLSSCEYIEDGRKSMVLSGEWRGDFGMFYVYRDGRGMEYTFDSYDTRITFIPAYEQAHYGRGTITTTARTSISTTVSTGPLTAVLSI